MLIKKIDSFITKPILSIPLFFIMLFLIFQITFTLGGYISNFLDIYLNKFYNILGIHNIFIDSIFGGIIGIIIFIPNIFILYLFLLLLNDSGVLPRISFVFDKIMNKIGLNSKSLLSISLGFGCTVGGILSTKEIIDKREKIITIFMLPFISCSAKIPVFTLFISMFIEKKYQSISLFGLVIFGLIIGVISTYIINKFTQKQNNHFIINIPKYRKPNLFKIIKKIGNIGKEFIFKIGILVIPISILLTLAFTFPKNNDLENTYGGKIGSYINYIFEPIGFTKEMSISIIGGLAGKEVIVSTMSSLYYIQNKSQESLKEKILNDKNITFASIISFLIFILFYTPCILAVITAKNELGYKLGFLFFIYPIIVAWLMSFIFYNLIK